MFNKITLKETFFGIYVLISVGADALVGSDVLSTCQLHSPDFLRLQLC